MKSYILTAFCLLALVACDKPATETKTEEKVTTTTGTAATTTTTTTTPVAIDDGDLSTPADFEETAEKAITAKTYKAELASLEADVAKD